MLTTNLLWYATLFLMESKNITCVAIFRDSADGVLAGIARLSPCYPDLLLCNSLKISTTNQYGSILHHVRVFPAVTGLIPASYRCFQMLLFVMKI